MIPIQKDEHERTAAFADMAIGQIRTFRHSARPRYYEVWYTYVTGYLSGLNRTINDTIENRGTITLSELDELYHVFLSPVRLSDSVDTVGSEVLHELAKVIATIETAANSQADFSKALLDTKHQLERVKDHDSLKAIVHSLVKAAAISAEGSQQLGIELETSKEEISRLKVQLETVRNESLTDPLTSLKNRASFDRELEQAVAASAKSREPLSLIMLDIDEFKSFNDRYGHITGDHVLRLVGQSLKQNVKGKDIAARYGGEEFGIILGQTKLQSAVTLADQIRKSVATKELMKRSTGESLGRVTVSLGVASWHPGESVQNFIERADSCLYVAKRTGRNRVICETDPAFTQAKVG